MTEFKELPQLNARIIVGENDHTRCTERQIGEYLAGQRRTFSAPSHAPGNVFQQSVWRLLQTVAFGQISSYEAQAEALGESATLGAVAAANGRNRIAIIVPCHRIVGQDGALLGYGGGMAGVLAGSGG